MISQSRRQHQGGQDQDLDYGLLKDLGLLRVSAYFEGIIMSCLPVSTLLPYSVFPDSGPEDSTQVGGVTHTLVLWLHKLQASMRMSDGSGRSPFPFLAW